MSKKAASFEELKKLDCKELLKISKEHCAKDARINEQRTTWTEFTKHVGKAMAALKMKFAELSKGNTIAPGATFKDWHKAETGFEPNNHAETCAVFYNTFVESGKISETDYDDAAFDWIASGCAAARNVGFNMESKAVQTIADHMKKPKGDTAKVLRQLKTETSGKAKIATTDEGGGKAVEITAQLVASMIRAGNVKGLQHVIVAEMSAEAAHASDLAENIQRFFYQASLGLMDAWEKSGVDSSKLAKWKSELNPAAVAAK